MTLGWEISVGEESYVSSMSESGGPWERRKVIRLLEGE